MVAIKKQIRNNRKERKDRRVISIENGVIKKGSISNYISSLNKSSIKNYYNKLIEYIESQLTSNAISDEEYVKIIKLIEEKLKDDNKVEHELLFSNLKENEIFLEENKIIESTRVNILLLSFFSILPLKKVTMLRFDDLIIVNTNDFIEVTIEKEKTTFIVTKFTKLFQSLLSHVKNKKDRDFLVQADSKIDYQYFNRYVELFFDKKLSEGGMRSIKLLFTDSKILGNS